MSNPAPEERPGADWVSVLGRIEQSLGEALAQTPEPPELPAEGPADDLAALGRLDERLARLQESLAKAERSAAEVEALLAERVRACEAWRKAAAALNPAALPWATPSRPGGALS